MKTKVLKTFIFTIFFTILFSFSIGDSQAATKQSFKDVPTTYWGYNDIEWAVSKGLIKGYSDGTFRTGGTLTEAQFAAVIARYYNPTIDQQPSGKDWSKKYYDFLKSKGILLPGHLNGSLKTKPIKRIDMAIALAKSQGVSGTQNQIIDWMYANKLTYGKGLSNNKYTDFGVNDILERSQVSAFFKRMDTNGMRTIGGVVQPTPVTPSPGTPVDGMPIPTGPLSGNALLVAMQPTAEYLGFEYNYLENRNDFVYGHRATSEYNPIPKINIYADDAKVIIDIIQLKDKATFDLAAVVAKVYGSDADYKLLSQQIYDYAQSGDHTKSLVKTINNYRIETIYYKMYPFDYVTIVITKQ